MTESGYRAFISYSHRDAAATQALHRRLEAYRIPRRLVGAEGAHGPVPRRLAPIFRDRDELPAAGDLSTTVRAALAVSHSLVILCSPHAAASPWVAREIEAFRDLNPGRPVLAAILEGEPADCFPAALGAAQADGAPAEPLAADLRRSGDGQRLGFLKLVAGITGVGLDALVQRDAARQVRRVTAVTLIAIATTLLMAMLTLTALNARREAEGQRAEAERLVDVMNGALRNKLKEVGRLDATTPTDRATLEYYERQPLASLPTASIRRFASALHASGENDLNRNDLNGASAKFGRAYRLSGPLLAAAPNDAESIFTHAQSEFWTGSIDYFQHRPAAARAAWLRYKALAERLIALDRTSPSATQQLAFANSNLCTVAMEPPRDLHAALDLCTLALAQMEQAARAVGDGSYDIDVANRHNWLAGINASLGDHAAEARHLDAEEKVLEAILRRTPLNLDVQDMWLSLQTSLARREAALGEIVAARKRLLAALGRADMMVVFDPGNQRWAQRKGQILHDLESITDVKLGELR